MPAVVPRRQSRRPRPGGPTYYYVPPSWKPPEPPLTFMENVGALMAALIVLVGMGTIVYLAGKAVSRLISVIVRQCQ